MINSKIALKSSYSKSLNQGSKDTGQQLLTIGLLSLLCTEIALPFLLRLENFQILSSCEI